MSKKKIAKTAEQVMAELQLDATYQLRKQQAHLKRANKYVNTKKELKQVEQTLSESGFKVDDLNDLVRKFAPLDTVIVDILLGSLTHLKDERAAEMVVRALAATRQAYSGVALCDLFDKTHDDNLKWAIINTLATRNQTGIQDRLTQILTNDYWREVFNKLAD